MFSSVILALKGLRSDLKKTKKTGVGLIPVFPGRFRARGAFFLWYHKSLYRYPEFEAIRELVRAEFSEFPEVTDVTLEILPTFDLGNDSSVFWSAPVGVTVWLKGRPAFGLGVVLGLRKRIYVRQIQGAPRIHVPPKIGDTWGNRLVSACKLFATRHGYSHVFVLSGSYVASRCEPHVNPREGQTLEAVVADMRRRMTRRYDQAGFVFGKKWNV